ncbi:MAG: glycosyltransferase [Ferruginibacter sp.]
MQLSIIIVNYNVKYFLEQCLCSVTKACQKLESEIIVVDNKSTDGSKEFLLTTFPSLTFIWNDENIGFAKANNQALAKAKGKYILFLNPDTIVPEDCFEKCLSFFSSHNNAGALGVKMIDGAGNFLKESKRAFPSPLTSLYKLTGVSKIFPHSKIFSKYHLGNLTANENHEVDVLAGAFMMVPLIVLKDVGSFDETFFMYGEDVDLSYRIQKAGYKNYYYSQTTIIHFKGESTKKGSLNYVRLFYSAMSLFVTKHYSGSRAGLFNILIQTGIFFRAIISAASKFLQIIGLPVLDAVIIFLSFWGTIFLWNTYIRNDVNYSPNLLIIALPIFTVIFLIASYYSGLYDEKYRQSQLNRATTTSALILLSSYALLPEDIRFSRGILVFGILMSFVLMSLLRKQLLYWNLLKGIDEDMEQRQTIVVASESDFTVISTLMNKVGMPERVLGRVTSNPTENKNTAIGTIQQLDQLIKMYPVKEIIFCADGFNFKEIIEIIQHLPRSVRNKFHATGSSSIVGSDDKDLGGQFVAAHNRYVIGNPVNKRNKNLLDILVAVIFLISLPFHLLIQKKPLHFLKNLFAVLFRKKTWVGYATNSILLPPIKPGVLTSTSLPNSVNSLPKESLQLSDEWYANSYAVSADINSIIRGYKYLCY